MLVSGNIYLFGRPIKIAQDIVVKTRDFFGETSPQTFVTRGLINSYCFGKDWYVV